MLVQKVYKHINWRYFVRAAALVGTYNAIQPPCVIRQVACKCRRACAQCRPVIRQEACKCRRAYAQCYPVIRREACKDRRACAQCRSFICQEACKCRRAYAYWIIKYQPHWFCTRKFYSFDFFISYLYWSGEGGWFFIIQLFKSILCFVNWISLYFFHILRSTNMLCLLLLYPPREAGMFGKILVYMSSTFSITVLKVTCFFLSPGTDFLGWEVLLK